MSSLRTFFVKCFPQPTAFACMQKTVCCKKWAMNLWTWRIPTWKPALQFFFLDSVILMSCWKPKKSSFIIPFWRCCPQTSQRQISSNLPPQSRLKLSHTHTPVFGRSYSVCECSSQVMRATLHRFLWEQNLKRQSFFSNSILCRAPVKSLTSLSLPLNRLTTKRNITSAADSACKPRFFHLLPQFPRKAGELRGWDSKWWCSGGVTAHFSPFFFFFGWNHF